METSFGLKPMGDQAMTGVREYALPMMDWHWQGVQVQIIPLLTMQKEVMIILL